MQLGGAQGNSAHRQVPHRNATFNTYEIHYVLHGVKKVALHPCERMTDFDAWLFVALECGVPRKSMPTERYLSLLMTAVENQGITKVRWNLSPRTGGFGCS